ncbi:hypothetical protein BGZ51_006212 [Haplosporangium sp. Z 767]|nr:hypothetical protein BGZ51_006212 [Haplosporangium sp. Z 767]KAF9191948.1 hypothetical protein BGZ50_008963 [Haplosporangium sp. Z 11]
MSVPSTSCTGSRLWNRSFSSMVFMALAVVCFTSTSILVEAQSWGSDFFASPSASTTWYLGDTVNIRFNHALSFKDSNNTMLYLEYTTRACQGSRPDAERYCDNRATKVSAMGQIQSGADSYQWTIPTTLDLQLSRGKFHLYDYNGHSSESFTIRPARRHFPKIGMVDQGGMAYLDRN